MKDIERQAKVRETQLVNEIRDLKRDIKTLEKKQEKEKKQHEQQKKRRK